MVTQNPEVDLSQPIDRLNQSLVIGQPSSGMWQFALGQEDRLGPVLIAVGQVWIGTMRDRVLWVTAAAIKVATLIAVLPQRAAQDWRPNGQRFQQPFPLRLQGVE